MALRPERKSQAVRDMAPQADEVVVLTESEKFSKNGIIPMNLPDQPRKVITDSLIPQEYVDAHGFAKVICRVYYFFKISIDIYPYRVYS